MSERQPNGSIFIDLTGLQIVGPGETKKSLIDGGVSAGFSLDGQTFESRLDEYGGTYLSREEAETLIHELDKLGIPHDFCLEDNGMYLYGEDLIFLHKVAQEINSNH